MALIENTLFGQHDRVQVAIDRLKTFEPQEGYYLAFSGGKDSCVIKELAKMAGVKFDAHFHNTTVEAPELIRFVMRHHSDVLFEHPKYSMRQLIIKKGFPPSRIVRYCCAFLKEHGGKDRRIITGVRKSESSKRSGRRTIEQCQKIHRTYVNPIVDWSDADVWDFIKKYNVPYCELYDQGFSRIGCMGCPMSQNQKKELERYPHIRKIYESAFKAIEEKSGQTAEKHMRWFTGDEQRKGNPDQTVLFE